MCDVLGNVVWLDEMTATRALINMSSLPAQDKIRSRDTSEEKSSEKNKKGNYTQRGPCPFWYTDQFWAFE